MLRQNAVPINVPFVSKIGPHEGPHRRAPLCRAPWPSHTRVLVVIKKGFQMPSKNPSGGYAMVDGPGPFDSLDEWEKHLNYIRQLPDDTINKQVLIEAAETFIQRRLGLIPPADDDDLRRAVEALVKTAAEKS
jgi:hypothetical protein